MENKIYILNDKGFKLRRKFIVDDLDVSAKVDAIMGKVKITQKEQSGNISENNDGSILYEPPIKIDTNFTSDDYKELAYNVLVPVDGQNVDKSFFGKIDQTAMYEVFTDFFLVYLQLSLSTEMRSQSFNQRANELMTKFGLLNKNSTSPDQNSSPGK